MSRPKVPVPPPMEFPQHWRQPADQGPHALPAEPEATYWPRQGAGQPPVHQTYSGPAGSADPVHQQHMQEAAALASYTPPHQSGYETRFPPQSAGSGFGSVQPLPVRPPNAHMTNLPPQASGDPPLPSNPYGRQQERYASAPYDQDGPPALQPARSAHEAGYAAHTAPPQTRRNVALDQWAASPAPPPPDAHGYHLDRYMPTAAAQSQDFGAAVSSGETQWAHGRDTYGLQVGEPSSDVTNYGMPQTALEPLQAGGEHLGYEPEEDLDSEPEERRRRPRLLIVAGALVGAIALGGGLAYTYKMVMGPAAKTVPPVIKADTKPAKVPPTEPGGKQFAHKDSKLMGRLGDDGDAARTASAGGAAASAPSAAEADASGPRRVTTLPVGRDGALLTPAPQPTVPPQASIVVPGTSVVIGGNPVQGSLAPATAPVVTSSTPPPAVSSYPPPAKSPTRPQVIAKAPPPPAPAAEPDQVAPESAVAAPSRSIVPRQAPPVAAAAPAAAPTPRAAVASSGFVAVMASTKSRIDALKTFADMQQKYGDVLQNKEPAVQEADLSARGLGIVYRVGVGPPGSREAANEVCTRLKAAGHSGCWVSSF